MRSVSVNYLNSSVRETLLFQASVLQLRLMKNRLKFGILAAGVALAIVSSGYYFFKTSSRSRGIASVSERGCGLHEEALSLEKLPPESSTEALGYLRELDVVASQSLIDHDAVLSHAEHGEGEVYTAKPYVRLTTIREIRERKFHELLFKILAENQEAIHSGKDAALAVSTWKRAYLFKKDLKRSVTLRALSEELEEWAERLPFCPLEEIQGSNELLTAEKVGFQWNRGAQNEANRQWAALSPEQRFENDLNLNVPKTQADLEKVFGSGREPNLAPRFHPSQGKSGNISGIVYPDRTFSLTFDDGPSHNTPKILEMLRRRQVRVNFFVLVRSLRDINLLNTARMAVEDGHELGNHTFSHPDVTRLAAASQDHQIRGSSRDFERYLGFSPRLFRLPFGAGVGREAVRRRIADAGMMHVHWNIDSLDWQDPSVDSVVRRVTTSIKKWNRGIILFHDTKKNTLKSSERVIDFLLKKENNYHISLIRESLDDLNAESLDHF
jgi:peptidoglycan-N-acetylglucosamine deacetylase